MVDHLSRHAAVNADILSCDKTGLFAAGMLLAAEAGALVSGWDGGVLRPLANADVLAAAPAAYSELRALTAQSARE